MYGYPFEMIRSFPEEKTERTYIIEKDKKEKEEKMLINEECRSCMIRKYRNAYPEDATKQVIEVYQKRLYDLMEHSEGFSTPQVAEKIHQLRDELFGNETDYSEIKRHYNALMMTMMSYMKEKVEDAEDRLKAAVQYAMVGNYIDFGALENVNEEELKKQLDAAEEIPVDPEILECFRKEVHDARRLVYFTDNCGEVVADKLLISVLREEDPDLSVTVIVRGKPTVNDATLEDMKQIGMEEVAHKVIGNGNGMPGNVIGTLSAEATEEVEKADLLISKGQGNYEGLGGCGLNVFYLFLCKCELFMRRFNVPKYTGIITRELRQ